MRAGLFFMPATEKGKERTMAPKGTSLNTHMGSISIDNEVIAQYAGSVANECFGIVGMAGVNMKEGIIGLLKKESMTVANNLIDSVKYKVEKFTGIDVANISVFVEGVRIID